MQKILKKFGQFKKKQYLCTRFCERTTIYPIVNSPIVNVYGGLSSVGRASDCGSECRGELKTKTLIRCN